MGVRYIGLVSEYSDHAEPPDWTSSPDAAVHCLDHGVELELHDERRFFVTWGDEFAEYHVTVYEGASSDLLGASESWDVTATSRWTSLAGQKIAQVDVHWSPTLSRDDFLQTVTDMSGGYLRSPIALELSFAEGGRVVCVAAELQAPTEEASPSVCGVSIDERKWLWLFGDDFLSVIFDGEFARAPLLVP